MTLNKLFDFKLFIDTIFSSNFLSGSTTFKFGGVVPGKLVQGKGWLDIDTGAYDSRSGWLTSLDMTNSIVYQANVFSRKTRVLDLSDIVQKM